MQGDPKKRIGIIGVYHESNTFLDQETTWEDFENGHVLYGQAIIDEYQTAFHEIGGIVEVLSAEKDIELVPIFYAEATPGGIIARETAEHLLNELNRTLKESLPLDGLMVVPHGAAVSVSYLDFDGHWLRTVREIMGTDLPIIGTIDPHCNLSNQMVDALDGLVAYKTNPHIDQRDAGRSAARIMADTLHAKVKPKMVLLQTNVAISIEMQHTGSDPCQSLFALAKSMQEEPEVLSTNVVLGFPYADVPEMGTSFIVITNNDEKLANDKADVLNEYLLKNHQDFSGKKIGLEELPEHISKAEKPLLILDMGDNVGGGSPADSTFLLEVLETCSGVKSFMCIYDPEAVAEVKNKDFEGYYPVKIGAKSDDLHGETMVVEVKLERVVDGKFTEKEPRHGGQVNFNMGETAIVTSKAGNTIMLTSLRMVPFSLQQLIHFDIDPTTYGVLVAKGVNAPLAAYQPVCNSIIRANTPGVTRADMASLNYKHRRKPLFPLDKIEVK
ncbi:M81 family metallopeptidase [Cyclobacterium marinum]|uniref:Microcystin LR degradation protein MlrC n=1 Tax=Cyclobacterium marinum (strain ATCC 25205 / DSM 745 / LMG 13164 / NCIMB 1802) TaxID=880070 RepID=G0IUW0_CYCMS|nr:M81 family metallopeptidase [Cyclobacterium marinum]AEL26184.1 Microcystin LR degradation protein MlrC [Cyclobacterium marinum DSM 745]MBI0399542.1 M81 family metallopeptidase [Cyclobacterium marinum]